MYPLKYNPSCCRGGRVIAQGSRADGLIETEKYIQPREAIRLPEATTAALLRSCWNRPYPCIQVSLVLVLCHLGAIR
jgi:hypothetical protein